MATGGLDYSFREKLDTQYLRDIAQLADRVRQVEPSEEKVVYVEADDYPSYISDKCI